MEIITGRTGQPHVYAADDAEIYKLFLGDGDFCLVTGNKLDAQVVTATQVNIRDGSLIMQGRLAKIRPSDGYDTMTLDAGTTGYKRVDLIVAEYSQETTETQVEQGGEVVTVRDMIETVELKVIKGTPNASAFVEPSITTGNIDNGDTHQMKLWAVRIDGINFDSIVDYRVFLDTSPIQTALSLATQSVAQIRAQMTTLTSDVASFENNLTSSINSFENNLNTSIYAYADSLREGISQGFQGRWRSAVTVTNASSAVAVAMANDYTYSASDVIDVYLNGLRATASEYTVTGSSHTINVTLANSTFKGEMEVVASRLSTEA